MAYASITLANVAVGDWLRCRADGWEGQVTAIDGDQITLRMNDRDPRVVTAADCYWNPWDPKSHG